MRDGVAVLGDILILVDGQDNFMGFMGKEEVHRKGLKHRAFSIIILNRKGEMLLQQRAKHKYHTPGLWSNTCCSHPRYGESLTDAIHRRLPEEMGFDTALEPIHSLSYRVEFDNGLIENEYDHVFLGFHEEDPVINPEEVHAFRWMSLPDLAVDMEQHPECYTHWFKLLMKELDLAALQKPRAGGRTR